MEKTPSIIDNAIETITIESNAIANLINFIDIDFQNAVKIIHESKGRLIITGIGKSANIANKIVSTLNSTGTPAIFMHAADAIHGDLGNIQKDDVVLCISKSGNTPEIKVLVPFIKKFGNPIIGMTANKESFLGKNSDYIVHSYVEKEACPNNLAPTSSTTAQLVLGDALAVCLLHLKGFSSADFAKYHPGGALGKKLYLRVEDIIKNSENPMVSADASIKEVIVEISAKRLGATVVGDSNSIEGIITDGDIRRMLSGTEDMDSLQAKDIMGANPKTIVTTAMAIDAKEIMENNKISQLIAVDENNKYQGIIHIHDLVKEGIF